eukprot:Pgem_evm1s4092
MDSVTYGVCEQFARIPAMDVITNGLDRSFVYFDDTLVASCSKLEHFNDLLTSVDRYIKHGVEFRLLKCHFACPEAE